MARCYHDPDLFNTAVLGRSPYWSRQREIARSIAEYRITVAYTGNALGKDYLFGGIIPWWNYTRPNSLVIVTGPSQTSLGTITWKELRKAVKGSRVPLVAKVSEGVKASPQFLKIAPGWGALGYSTTNVERASGQHNANLLVGIMEASGVEDETWDAVDSLKYKRLFAYGNPIRAEGRFVDLIRQAEKDRKDGVPRHLAVNAIQVASTESPHAEMEESEWGLADRTWLEDCARRYGVDSPWYRSHVLAILPTLANEQLIPVEDLDRCITDGTKAAAEALRAEGLGGRARMSCDVGEGCGNARTVVIVRDELGVLEVSASRYLNPSNAAETMGRLGDKWQVRDSDMSFDGAGQTGKRLGNALSGRGMGRARAYFGSGSGGRRCTNLRTACALAFARRLDPRHHTGGPWRPFHIPPGEHWQSMREELLALRYELAGDKSKLEDKDDLMDRLGRSPDYADATCQGWREDAVAG